MNDGIFLVTGANRGLGRAVVEGLARAGSPVVLAARDVARGEAAREEVLRAVPGAAIEVRRLDLADPDSIRALALDWGERPLRGLVHNAAAVPAERTIAPDGHEVQLATHVLGPFALTARLMPALTAGRGRVVTVSSIAHWSGSFRLDDDAPYEPWRVYARTKLLGLVFAIELDRRLRSAGSPVASLAAHPGLAATELFGAGPTTRPIRTMRRLTRWFARPPEAGAAVICSALTAPDARGGEYRGPGFLGWFGPARARPRSPAASRRRHGEALWAFASRETGLQP